MTDDDSPPGTALADQPMRQALMRELNRQVEHDGQTITRLELIIRKLVDKAEAGDMPAVNQVMDRADGKPLAGVVPADQPPQGRIVRWED
jgi:Family of unknown function (DUF5681)